MMRIIMYSAVDLFSGVGGMSLGFIRGEFRILVGVDHDPIHVRAYQSNLSSIDAVRFEMSAMLAPDFRAQIGIRKEEIDVVFGGPPCQGFSTIGKRAPGDVRRSLVIAFAKAVTKLNPKYFVMENVAGLLEKRFVSLLGEFADTCHRGKYSILEPVEILDAAQFGVPQSRRRAFVLGYRNDLPAPRYPQPFSTSSPTVRDAIGDLPYGRKAALGIRDNRYYGDLGKPSDYARNLTGNPGVQEAMHGASSSNGSIGGGQISLHGSAVVKRFRNTKPGTREAISRYPRLSWSGVAPTLRAGTTPEHGAHTAARPIHPEDPRCITPREAARLQSFPDWYEFDKTIWHSFRQIGNSVPPLLAQAVAEEIHSALSLA